jgi:hypothetical protein
LEKASASFSTPLERTSFARLAFKGYYSSRAKRMIPDTFNDLSLWDQKQKSLEKLPG